MLRRVPVPRSPAFARRAMLGVSMLGALLLMAAPLSAQRPVSIGVGGGLSLPLLDLADDAGTGWHALGSIMLSTLMQPIGLRVDAAYHRFPLTDSARTAFGENGGRMVASATLNATYRLPLTDAPASPYLIAGLGGYRTGCAGGDGCDADTRFGWNAGVGSKFYFFGVRSFVEGRFHYTQRGDRNAAHIPVTLGLMF